MCSASFCSSPKFFPVSVVTAARAERKMNFDQTSRRTFDDSVALIPAPRRSVSIAAHRSVPPFSGPKTSARLPPICRITPGASMNDEM